MAMELLHCSICPKLPTFSDTSHLLTHVSSKGHLAHLHRLQVRSHQEIAAGAQLATYNQWYQQHGLGQLLSERMQQKEAKQANQKRATAAKRKSHQAGKNTTVAGGGSWTQPLPPRLEAKAAVRGCSQKINPTCPRRLGFEDDNESDLDYSPGYRPRTFHRQSVLLTPTERQPFMVSYHASDIPLPTDIDPMLVLTPENKRLKGTVWPGMAMFDSASVEEQRLRNQKKDGSVVKRMERLSRLVQPTEAVYTPGGDLRKERHIDDLDDDSSLIEGESPLAKKPIRRKRKPLADVSANVPRLVKRKAKVVQPKNEPRSLEQSGLPDLKYIPSSSTHASYGPQSRYSPTADENLEFKLAAGDLSARKKLGNFTIFNDNTATHTVRASGDLTYQGFDQSIPPFIIPAQPRLTFAMAPWLQPQYQQPVYYDNHYSSYRPAYPTYSELQDLGFDKQDVFPVLERSPNRESHITNPLLWRPTTIDEHTQPPSSEATFGALMSCFAGGANIDDPFGCTRNPLFDGSCSPGKTVTQGSKIESPNGTDSEPDMDEAATRH